MGLAKGVNITNIRALVNAHFHPSAWQELVMSVPRADKLILLDVVSSGWYSADLYACLMRTLCDHLGGGSVAIARELGRFEADMDLATVYRWFLRLMKPSFAIRQMDNYWRRLHDTGSWRSDINEQEIIATLSGWSIAEPAVCADLVGYLGRMLELFGGDDVRVEHTQCRGRGEPVCEFRAHCALKSRAPKSSKLTREDIPIITRELAQYTDPEPLADAIVDLLRIHAQCTHILLWHQPAGGGAMRLLRAAGKSGAGNPYCFVLDRGGRVVGRLDIEVAQTPLTQMNTEILEELLSCLSVPLDDVLSGRADADGYAGPPSSTAQPALASHLKERIDRAAGAWGLTPTETGVLAHVIRGETNKDIAKSLSRTEGVIETHISHIFRKCGVENRASLIAKFWSEF